MPVPVIAELSSTELNKTSGKVLDIAAEGPVRVLRRTQRFVVLKEETLEGMLDAAREDRPQSLDDLLRNYDKKKIHDLAGGFLTSSPAGKEII